MERIGVRELKEQASEIIRRVREEGDSFEVTYRGRAVALMVPVREPSNSLSSDAFMERWDALADAIGAAWPKGVSALSAVNEQRRDL
jgi:prevent-host-death family protein